MQNKEITGDFYFQTVGYLVLSMVVSFSGPETALQEYYFVLVWTATGHSHGVYRSVSVAGHPVQLLGGGVRTRRGSTSTHGLLCGLRAQ